MTKQRDTTVEARTAQERRRWRLRRSAVAVAFLLTGLGSVVAFAGSGGTPAPTGTITVRAGDTLGAIAARIGVDGGWQALYQANRTVIGPDPARLEPGEVLTVPHAGVAVAAPSTSYVVQPGDTLTAISQRFHLVGGVDSLYAANRVAVGRNADRLVVGQILALPTAPKASAPGVPAARTGTAVAPAPPAAVVVPPQVRSAPALVAPDAGTGRSAWRYGLVGLCALGAVLALCVLLRSRRRTAVTDLTPMGVLTFVQGGTAEVPAITATSYGAAPRLPQPRDHREGDTTSVVTANSAIPAASDE